MRVIFNHNTVNYNRVTVDDLKKDEFFVRGAANPTCMRDNEPLFMMIHSVKYGRKNLGMAVAIELGGNGRRFTLNELRAYCGCVGFYRAAVDKIEAHVLTA